MKFIDKKISNFFFQCYIILDSKEKMDIITKIRQDELEIKKQEIQEKIKLYKNINKSSNSEKSKNKYIELVNKLHSLTIDSIILDIDSVPYQICESILRDIIAHLTEINVIQVLNYDASMIGKLEDLAPLTIVYSFPYISGDYAIEYPKTKGNGYLFTNKDVDMIQTELLIANNLYKKNKVSVSTEFSDLSFTYICDDDFSLNNCMDINQISEKYNIEREQLIGLERSNYMLSNNLGQKCIINVKEIYDKSVVDLNDEIVKKMNYLNTKTVKELRKKIFDVFSFIYNVNSNVMSIIENFAKVNNFSFDDYCLNHYLKIMEKESIDEDDIYQLKLNYVTAYLFHKQDADIEKYFFYIEQEYKLLYQVKNHVDNMSYEDYFGMKAPYYALYDYFKQKNLITERSYDE